MFWHTGAIVGEWDTCKSILQKFQNDPDTCVAESCIVALDAMEYWQDTETTTTTSLKTATETEAQEKSTGLRFKQLKEQQNVKEHFDSETYTNNTNCNIPQLSQINELNAKTNPMQSEPRTLTASNMKVSEAAWLVLFLRHTQAASMQNKIESVVKEKREHDQNLEEKEENQTYETVNQFDSIIPRILLHIVGKLKRKGFYPSQESGERNFDGDGLLAYISTADSDTRKPSIIFTSSDSEFDTSALTKTLPCAGVDIVENPSGIMI